MACSGQQLPGTRATFIKWTGWTLTVALPWRPHHTHCHCYSYYCYYYYYCYYSYCWYCYYAIYSTENAAQLTLHSTAQMQAQNLLYPERRRCQWKPVRIYAHAVIAFSIDGFKDGGFIMNIYLPVLTFQFLLCLLSGDVSQTTAIKWHGQ